MFVSLLSEETEQGSERTSSTSTCRFIKTSTADVTDGRVDLRLRISLINLFHSGCILLIAYLFCSSFIVPFCQTGRVSRRNISKHRSQISVKRFRGSVLRETFHH